MLNPSSETVTAAGARHRAAAFLLRMALEEALRRYWERVRPEMNNCRPHMRSVCLEFYGGAGLSGRWSACWNALSRACHYHGYGLTPGAAELRARRDDAAGIIHVLSRAAASGFGSHSEHRAATERRTRS